MATKLKVVEQVADIVLAPTIPEFDLAPTRKRRAGWTAERQRKFIEHLSLTGNVGEACAVVGVASSSAYRLCNQAGAESFAQAGDSALRLAATRLAAIMRDRAVNGRVERFYKDGELVMERRIPSDYLLTWLLSRLDPLQFGSPAARALAAATGDTDIAPDVSIRSPPALCHGGALRLVLAAGKWTSTSPSPVSRSTRCS